MEDLPRHHGPGIDRGKPITDQEIDAYLDGELSGERAQQIEELARQDPELAAKITVIGYFSGVIAQGCANVVDKKQS